MLNDFQNAKAEKTFFFEADPTVSRRYTILGREKSTSYAPVGNYTVLDRSEDASLSEKKVMNLISLLNGTEDLLDIQKEVAGTRLYYNMAGEQGNQQKIIFYNNNGNGVSKENALLLIDKEILGNG